MRIQLVASTPQKQQERWWCDGGHQPWLKSFIKSFVWRLGILGCGGGEILLMQPGWA
jgi:hypothetical protein